MTASPTGKLRDAPAWKRPVIRAAQSRIGGWWFINVGRRIDPFLLRASNGRISTALGQPVLLLEMRGAKTGQPRSLPLVYATDGDDILLVASKGGSPKHPSWYHNLRAHPNVAVLAGRRSGPSVAREAADQERERLWDLVTTGYPGYDAYQARTGGRTIPVVVLEPEPEHL